MSEWLYKVYTTILNQVNTCWTETVHKNGFGKLFLIITEKLQVALSTGIINALKYHTSHLVA